MERYTTELSSQSVNESKLNGTQDPVPEDDEAAQARQAAAEEKARLEEQRKAELDQEYSQYKLQGSTATLAMENGSIIGMLPNGYIMQTRSIIQKDLISETEREYGDDVEESRVITGKSCIRYLMNGRIEILHANGNFSVYDPTTDLWTITNNFGKRRCKRHSNGDTFDIDPIPAAVETCAETSAQVLFKEDNVISILYPNGTRYTIHHDGTKIITNSDQSEIVFEKIGYSQIKVLSGRMLEEPEKIKDMSKSDADLEFYESLQTSRAFLKDRIMNGQVIQTYLHDKTVIQSFVEINEFGQENNGEPEIDLNDNPEGINQEDMKVQDAEGPYCQAVHLIRRQDLSVTKVTQDGEA